MSAASVDAGDELEPLMASSRLRRTKSALLSSEQQLSRHAVEQAAMCVEFALRGRATAHAGGSAGGVPRDYHAKRLQLFLRLRPLRMAVVVIYLAISFVEQPIWCYYGDCGSHDRVLRANLPVLPIFATNMIELVCIVLLSLELLLHAHIVQSERILHSKWSSIKAVLLFASAIDVLVSLSYGKGFRIAPFIRPIFFVIHSSRVRKTCIIISRIAVKVADVLLLVFVFVVFYGVLGLLLFQQTEEASDYFIDIGESFISLFTLLTTANYPDVMVPIYTQNRLACIFFITFLVFGLFFLMNLVLASIYNHYKQMSASSAKVFFEFRHTALTEAFHILDPYHTRCITTDLCRRLLTELRRYRRIHTMDDNKLEYTLLRLDRSRDGVIHKSDFYQLCDAIQSRLVRQEIEVPCNWCPRFRKTALFQIMDRVVRHRHFDTAVSILIMVNIICTFAEMRSILRERRISGISSWEFAELSFSTVYVVEVALKVFVLGFRQYWRSVVNRFDAFVALSTFVAEMYIILPSSFNDPSAFRYILLLRFLRVLRVLSSIRSYRTIVSTLARTVPAFRVLLATLFAFMYFFSQLGVAIYGGVINKDNPDIAKFAPEFTTAQYWVNNFNDFPSGLVTLFELLIVNNWWVIMKGFVAATDTKVTRIFFVVWYIVGVVMILNTVIAFVIDTFISEYSNGMERETGDDPAVSSSDDADIRSAPSIGSDLPPGYVVRRLRGRSVDVLPVGSSSEYERTPEPSFPRTSSFGARMESVCEESGEDEREGEDILLSSGVEDRDHKSRASVDTA